MKRVALIACILSASPALADNVTKTTAPNPGGMTWISVTCGSTSTPFGIGAGEYMTVQIPLTASQSVFFGWGGSVASPTIATAAPPSQSYSAGTTITWGGGTGSCIVASGSQTISVGYR